MIMGEILPDGSIQGYQAYCQKCGKTINVNAQGTELINERHICIPIIKTGKIKIKDNEIVFVYFELPEPKWIDYNDIGFSLEQKALKGTYNQAMKEYEASKREVEVENIIVVTDKKSKFLLKCYVNENDMRFKSKFFVGEFIKHNQPCEAEVNGKAMITKII